MVSITPWEVKGSLEYERIIREFGLQRLDDHAKHVLQDCLLIRRGIILAGRDFRRIIDRLETGKPFTVLTGLMPSGKMHLGHMLVIRQLIYYQQRGARIVLVIADAEAYVERGIPLREAIRLAVDEYLTHYILLGLRLEDVDFYFQTFRSLDGMRASAYDRVVKHLARHTTVNEFEAIYGTASPGRIMVSTVQAADILHPMLPEFYPGDPVLVPVGFDQDAHIRYTRDLAQRYKEYAFMLPSSTVHVFAPGLKGGKMSSSDPTSYIALTDTPEEAERKIMKYAFSGGGATIEEHRKHGGNPTVDVSFQILRYGFEEDDERLAEIEAAYRQGDLLTGELKRLAADRVKVFLKELAMGREAARARAVKLLEERFPSYAKLYEEARGV